MGLNIVEIPKAGGFFSPKEHSEAVAILIEVRRIERQRPGGNYGPKDTVHADVTIFPDQQSLDAGTPVEAPSQMIQQTLLFRDLEPLVGNATIVSLGRTEPSKPGQSPAWVWRSVDGATKQKVIDWANKREAALEEAKSSGEMPSFLA